ncbi:hypothetical protein HZH66_014850 [Vespula vulgaris]|uniref:Uncharacterized protein n=1 Tax=Vespula vulgaris TaxID=7454 RepID=A0A834J028_VESVU|nr:hypothetical protein HZH66_014850 [Vespula vulgaris]
MEEKDGKERGRSRRNSLDHRGWKYGLHERTMARKTRCEPVGVRFLEVDDGGGDGGGGTASGGGSRPKKERRKHPAISKSLLLSTFQKLTTTTTTASGETLMVSMSKIRKWDRSSSEHVTTRKAESAASRRNTKKQNVPYGYEK